MRIQTEPNLCTEHVQHLRNGADCPASGACAVTSMATVVQRSVRPCVRRRREPHPAAPANLLPGGGHVHCLWVVVVGGRRLNVDALLRLLASNVRGLSRHRLRHHTERHTTPTEKPQTSDRTVFHNSMHNLYGRLRTSFRRRGSCRWSRARCRGRSGGTGGHRAATSPRLSARSARHRQGTWVVPQAVELSVRLLCISPKFCLNRWLSSATAALTCSPVIWCTGNTGAPTTIAWWFACAADTTTILLMARVLCKIPARAVGDRKFGAAAADASCIRDASVCVLGGRNA